MVLGDNLQRNTILDNLNVLMLLGCQNEFFLNLIARNVFMMEHSELGMTALFGQCKAAVLVFVEIHAPLHQFHHTFGSLANGKFHDFAVGELVAGHHSILNVFLVSVWLIDYGGDTALGIAGGAIVHLGFGHHEHFAEVGGFECEGQSCHAGSNNQKINFFAHFRVYF